MHVVLATAQTHLALTPSDHSLRVAIEARGAKVTAEPWDSITPSHAGRRLVCLRSTWDYQYRVGEFQRWVAAWNDRPGALWNPPATVLWNLDKVYLRDLEDAGIPIPVTHWFDPGHPPDVSAFFTQGGPTVAVVKPRISATALGTSVVKALSNLADTTMEPLLATGSMLQAFVPEISTNGELSLIFIDGRFSHAVSKRPADGDFRVQSDFGGSVAPHAVAEDEREFGEKVLAVVRHPWLYARVDMVIAAQGPLLMELELIEPELFLDMVPNAAVRLAEAIIRVAQRLPAGARAQE